MNPRAGLPAVASAVPLHVESYAPESQVPAATTVVFCHGFGGSARNFRPQARALRAWARSILYDARGHARSRADVAGPHEVEFRLEALTGDLGRVVDDYAQSDVVLVGLSLGAATALAYAIEHPEKVRGLLLASYPNAGRGLRQWALEFADAIEQEGIEASGERYVWGESARFDQAARALIRQGFLEHSASALAGLLRHGLAQLPEVRELAASLRLLQIPTSVVVGGADIGCIEPSQLLSGLIPNASLSVLDGAGHVVNLERVSEFNAELKSLISRTR